MKYLFLAISFVIATAESHETKSIPKWLRDALEDVPSGSAKLAPKPMRFSLKMDGEVEIDEQIGGYGVRIDTIDVKATLLEAKSVVALDKEFNHKWNYCAGKFKCGYPETNKYFEIWVFLKAINEHEDPLEVAKEIVSSDNWKGLQFRTGKYSKFLLRDGVLVNENNVKVGEQTPLIQRTSCIYNDDSEGVVVQHLPFRYHANDNSGNGLIPFWWAFSERQVVASMEITKPTNGHGDQVKSINIIYYDLVKKEMKKIPIKLDLATLVASPQLNDAKGKRVNLATEAIERPIKIFRLKEGKNALKLYLPKAQKQSRGVVFVIPEDQPRTEKKIDLNE